MAGAADKRHQCARGHFVYQYWQAALDANAPDRLKGIGSGTFEFWWSRHSTTPGFIRDAHTLYFETLGETGIIGLALLGGLLLWMLGMAFTRSLRAPPGVRLWIAAATGGLAAFMTAAAFEWVWEMAAISAAVMALGAVIVAGRDNAEPPASPALQPSRGLAPRAILALMAVAALHALPAMTDPRDIRADLEPDTPDDLVRLAERLEHERPVPAAAFRGDLRQRLMAAGVERPRPARLRALIAGYAAAGTLLLLAGALSAAGAGPLGA